jgi:hypothetical protein
VNKDRYTSPSGPEIDTGANGLMWRMEFPDQPCVRCGELVVIAESKTVTDSEGKLLGFIHLQCPKPERSPQ